MSALYDMDENSRDLDVEKSHTSKGALKTKTLKSSSQQIEIFQENPIEVRRFIDSLPKEVKMPPRSWVPGYRSIVQERRKNGLSGAGITLGVDAIVSAKMAAANHEK